MRNSRQNDKLDQLVMHTALKMWSWDRSSAAINKKFFSTFVYFCYTDKAFLSVSLVINSQLEAETH